MIPKKLDTENVAILNPIVDRVNGIIDELQKIKDAKTSGLTWLYSDNNLYISVGSNSSNQVEISNYGSYISGSMYTHPFQIKGIISGSSAYLQVVPGTINNSMPYIGASSLAAMPPPLISISGTSGIVYVKATLDAGNNVIDLEIIEDSGPIPSDTTYEKYILIGSWTSSSGYFTSIYSYLVESQTLYICSGTAIWESR